MGVQAEDQGADPRQLMISQIHAARLYGILDMGYVQPSQMLEVAEALLTGGAGVLQLRAKGYDAQGVVQLVRESAPGLGTLCRKHGVPWIINDFPDAAVELHADGVHVGQDDGALEDVRKIVGEKMLVGRSTHSPGQAQAAMEEGFDYIGFGPLFPTPTKQGRPGIGLDNVRAVVESVETKIPVFCIGGVKPDNLDLVLASGARCVVIVSALLQAGDVTQATADALAVIR